MKLNELRKWLAIGSGVGVEIRGADLHVMVVKVRPSGVRLLGASLIRDFRTRPALEWGADYKTSIKKLGAGHLTATVLLPRDEVIIRQLALPGVADKELDAAIRYQIDALHPWAEEDAVWASSRIGGSATVLIGITRRDTLERYLNLFTEAGIKVASFTFSAAVIYSALRIYGVPPANGFLALHATGEGVEAYGESEAKPIFSAAFPVQQERARALAGAELRLPADAEAVQLADVLPYPKDASRDNAEYRESLADRVLPYAAALQGACWRFGLSINLLPEALRSSGSRLLYLPTGALAAVLLLMLAAAALEGNYSRRRYLAVLEAETRKIEPGVARVSALDKTIEDARQRTRQLDDFRRRTKDDMDAISEMTHILPPAVWLGQLDLARNGVAVGGEADQAAPLIKLIDSSRLFENTEFTMPLIRVAGGEAFRLRTFRRDAPKEAAAP